jgi:hypothetical protein
MDMNKIIAFVLFLSTLTLIVVLYIVSYVMHKMPVHIAIIIGSIVAVSDISLALFFLYCGKKKMSQFDFPANTSAPASMNYSDNLIAIDSEGITLKVYYHPFCNSKRIKFEDIKTITAIKGGCWRLWGSDDFQTWFGLDWGRMNRKMRFELKSKIAGSALALRVKIPTQFSRSSAPKICCNNRPLIFIMEKSKKDFENGI